MKMRWLLVVLLGVAQLGFFSSSKAKTAQDVLGLEEPQILRLDSQEKQELRLKKFLDEKTLPPSEKEKIAYLLASIRNSGAIFLRNGNEYDANKASRWLQWKMFHRQYRKNPIRTAHDFVHRVANASKQTRLPYYMVLTSGEQVKVEDVLAAELATLEEAVQLRIIEEFQPEATTLAGEAVEPVVVTTPAPVLVPAKA